MAQLVLGTASCEANGCGIGTGQFCGIDGTCHDYSCQNFFQLGPRNHTGYDGAGSAELLKCENIPEGEPNYSDPPYSLMVSNSYRCRDSQGTARMGFTRRCDAKTSLGNFTCLEISSTTSFASFLARVEAAKPLECDDVPGWPLFGYYKILRTTVQRKDRVPGLHTTYSIVANYTEEFNEVYGRRPIATNYEPILTEVPTLSPTLSPTAVPTVPTISAMPSVAPVPSSTGYCKLTSMVSIIIVGALVF